MHMNWAGAKFDLHIQINEHSILLVVGISQIFCSVLNKGHLGVTVLTVFWENQKNAIYKLHILCSYPLEAGLF